MKKLKNILFLLCLAGLISILSIALLLPEGFYEKLPDKLFSTNKNQSTEKNIQLTKKDNEAKPVGVLKTNDTKTKNPVRNSDIEVIDGMDWRLPNYAKRSNFGGLVSETRGPTDYIRADFHIVRWDRTNPQQGKYEFTELQQALNQRPNQQIVLRPEIHSKCEAPAWALEQLRYTRNGSLIFWDEQYLSLLKPYIGALAQFVSRNPQIVGVQLGIGDGEYRGDCNRFELKDGWGEFNMNPEELLEAENDFKFTPALLESSAKNIINAFASDFTNNRHKLIFNNLEQYSWQAIAEPYNQRMPAIANFVLDKGIGARDGQVEHWMRYIRKVLGMKLNPIGDGTCALDMDEKFADRIAYRYWGTENEIYGNLDYVTNQHGSYQNQGYRFLISSLRALQMRRNYSLIYADAMKKIDHPVYKTQEFLRYLDKTMGKLRSDTPDLFILLGERYVADFRLAKEYPERKSCQSADRTAIRSFGRWITEKSNSQPAMRVEMPANDERWGQGFYLPEGVDYEYAARSSKEFAFNINEQLGNLRCPKGCQIIAKLTYLDEAISTVWLEGTNQKTQELKTRGDGKLRTASFNIDLSLNNSPDMDDLWIKSTGAPLNLMLLRINLPNP